MSLLSSTCGDEDQSSKRTVAQWLESERSTCHWAIVASEKPSSFHGEATLFVGQISCPVNKSSLHGTKDEKVVTPIIILHSLMLVVGIDFKRHLPISIHQLQVPWTNLVRQAERDTRNLELLAPPPEPRWGSREGQPWQPWRTDFMDEPSEFHGVIWRCFRI